MTLGQHLYRARQRLIRAGVATPELDAVVLFEYAAGKTREWLYTHADDTAEEVLNIRSVHTYDKLIKRRERSEPVAYIVGKKEFYGLSFSVTPDVMIPRPESEALVDYALGYAPKNAHMLDIGTGSGALAVALKTNRSDIDVTASDISPQAVALARQNARHHHAEIHFRASDMFAGITDTFDVILANLPYVKPDAELTPDSEYEPRGALNGQDRDGLELYCRLLRSAPEYLVRGGMLALEADPWQHAALMRYASHRGFRVSVDDSFMLALELPANTGVSES